MLYALHDVQYSMVSTYKHVQLWNKAQLFLVCVWPLAEDELYVSSTSQRLIKLWPASAGETTAILYATNPKSLECRLHSRAVSDSTLKSCLTRYVSWWDDFFCLVLCTTYRYTWALCCISFFLKFVFGCITAVLPTPLLFVFKSRSKRLYLTHTRWCVLETKC